MVQWLSHEWAALLAVIQTANPIWLFLAVAILPLIGFPASVLIIATGMRFGTAAGMALVAGAYLINFTAGYWMARSWFRAPLGRWLEKRGQKLPQVSGANETQFILLLRITPGVPLFMQTYALGFAQVHFGRYLLYSMIIQMLYVYAFLSFGQSLDHGTWHIILAVALIIALGLMINLFRRWLASRRAPIVKP